MWPIIAWLALAWSPVSCLVLPSHQGRSLSAAPLAAPTLAHKTTRTPDRNLATIAARHFVVRMNEQVDYEDLEYSFSLAKRANMFHKELNGTKSRLQANQWRNKTCPRGQLVP